MGASAHSAGAKAEGACLGAGRTTRRKGATMLIAQRTAKVTWDGSLAGGSGRVSSGSGALAVLPVTWAARTEAPAGKTSPEELIAAAHATCFTMALALVLGEAGPFPNGSRREPGASSRRITAPRASRGSRSRCRHASSRSKPRPFRRQSMERARSAQCRMRFEETSKSRLRRSSKKARSRRDAHAGICPRRSRGDQGEEP